MNEFMELLHFTEEMTLLKTKIIKIITIETRNNMEIRMKKKIGKTWQIDLKNVYHICLNYYYNIIKICF